MSSTITLPNGRGIIRGAPVTDAASGKVLTHRFAGVPYALPPTGARRWKKPVPLPADYEYGTGDKAYDRMPLPCYQPSNYTRPTLSDPNPKSVDPEASAATEDCLYLNIWVPASASSSNKPLPVLFYIHGGWLQIGSALLDPRGDDPSELVDLAAKSGKEFIIVTPGYRLNVFGFFAHRALGHKDEDGSASTTGNFGFWDQRLALEWTAKNIGAFGGDAGNITLWGLSAGAHSCHSQLLYEYMLSKQQGSYSPLIRRVFFQSNALVLPAKHVTEAESQLDELCALLAPQHANASDEEKIDALRAVPAIELVKAIPRMYLHTFRSTFDDRPEAAASSFVSKDWLTAMQSGDFGRWCHERGIAFIIGEVANEDTMYRVINAPEAVEGRTDLAGDLLRQVHNYYPLHITKALIRAYPPLPADASKEEYALRFGHITSDSQVFAAERLFMQDLIGKGDAASAPLILRYRIEFRAPMLDAEEYASMGVSHGFDNPLWRFKRTLGGKTWQPGQLDGLERWLEPFIDFVHGGLEQGELRKKWYGNARLSEGDDSAPTPIRAVRVFKSDATIETRGDRIWKDKLAVVQAMQQARFEQP